MKRITATICGLLMLTAPLALADTFVHVETRMGAMDFQLFDDLAPITVANFLNYVNDGDFDGTFIHRSVPGFVIQGGGFTYDPPTAVVGDPPIVNEFDPATMSNIRGTLAMARGTDLDSATSQWFINLVDNDMLDEPWREAPTLTAPPASGSSTWSTTTCWTIRPIHTVSSAR